MKKIKYYLGRYWYAYALAIIGLLVYEGLDMVSPQVTKSIIDDVIGDGRTELLPRLLLILMAVGLGRIGGGYLREFTFDKTSFRVASDIRKDLLGHIQSLSVDYFDRTNTGELMARVKDDVDRVQSAFGFIGMLSIQVVIHTFLVLYFMFRISWKLTIFPLVAMTFCGVLAVIMERKLDKVYDDISDENAEMNTVAEENLAGVRVVKAFAREKHEISKFLGHNRKYYDLNMKMSKVWVKYDPYFELATKLLPLVAILGGGVMVIRGELTLGSLGAFVEYCSNAVWPMTMLGWLSNELAAAFASQKKLDKIYKEVPMIKDPGKTEEQTGKEGMAAEPAAGITSAESVAEQDAGSMTAGGSVTFEGVSLKLGDKQILRDISFDLPAGKTLGIMGATGSGKSSIVNMLLRFYDADEGCVKLDGRDIRELPLGRVRSAVATVMQDVFLFSDTISENVRLGKKDATDAVAVDAALKTACADEFVKNLADGADTVIGERGVGLSGGQKQRISMARAFAKKAPILVLDDSTSALDMETEHQVQKNLEAMAGMTKIIIGHRISSVRHADEIIVLEEGRIRERGSHEELLAQKGYYYQTYLAQYGAGTAAANMM